MRFRELQVEKELRQLQEDKKNDRKPPPYKHIKVRAKTEWLETSTFDIRYADVYLICTCLTHPR